MIRLIVALIGLLLLIIWVATPLAKRTKILISALALIAAVTLASIEIYNNKPRSGLVESSEIALCGLSVMNSYRSDYKVALCLKNTSAATVKRITFQIDGSRCPSENVKNTDKPDNNSKTCESLDSVRRDLLLTMEPSAQINLQETLRFDALRLDDVDVSWSASILDIKAVP